MDVHGAALVVGQVAEDFLRAEGLANSAARIAPST
jgi:hypothetical protein